MSAHACHNKSLSLIIALLSCCPTAHGYDFACGTGELNDPYGIATAAQLISIGSDPNLLDKHYILLNDLDLDPKLPGGQVFTRAVIAPDLSEVQGFQGDSFTGIFDGAGLTVSSLTIEGESYLALFGRIGTGGRIKNLRIENAHIMGKRHGVCGASLVGRNDGDISDCHASGYLIGDDGVGGLVGSNATEGVIRHSSAAGICGTNSMFGVVGGLAGYNWGTILSSSTCTEVSGWKEGQHSQDCIGGLVGLNGGSTLCCYASGAVTGHFAIGGLVGNSYKGRTVDCYATGDVSSDDFTTYIGGLVGFNQAGTIVNSYATGRILNGQEQYDWGGLAGRSSDMYYSGNAITRTLVVNSFWNRETSGVRSSSRGLGLTTRQMMDSQVYSFNGWADDPNWVLDSGKDYPRLVWEGTPGGRIPKPSINWFDGSGSQDDPYVITSASQLALIGTASVLWDKAFVLSADVDLAGIDVPRIGLYPGNYFDGTFDGGDHVIHSLNIDFSETTEQYVGLFGCIGCQGHVHRLTILNASVKCGELAEEVGILAGHNEGVVSDCAISGSISGDYHSWRFGSLAGTNEGSIEGCKSTGSVSTGIDSWYVGALVGYNVGSITDCSSTATVSAGRDSHWVGGLVGYDASATKVAPALMDQVQ